MADYKIKKDRFNNKDSIGFLNDFAIGMYYIVKIE